MSPQVNYRRTLVSRLCIVGVFAVALSALNAQTDAQTITGPVSSFSEITNIGSAGGSVAQMAFAPGDSTHLYVSTFGSGIWRYDYDPDGVISNGVTVVPTSISSQSGSNGSLGIAFHQDSTLGTVMYIAPSVPFASDSGQTTIETQSIIRLTDANNDGMWGDTSDGSGDVNQAIVNNLQVTQLHQTNQLQVHGNRLYVAVGTRTSHGGDLAAFSATGETAYTGAVNFIDDLSLLSSDTTTANLAGFTIDDHQTDTQMFTSTDASKLRVFSTGFRNNYGLVVDGDGNLLVSMNQGGGTANTPDELHLSSFQEDHGFFKINDDVGDWKTNTDALEAGYFTTTTPGENPPDADISIGAGSGGLDFVTTGVEFLNHAIVSQFAENNIMAADLTNGNVIEIANGFNRPLEVLTDANGNLLIGDFGGSFNIHRITVVPKPARVLLVGESILLDFGNQAEVDGVALPANTNQATSITSLDGVGMTEFTTGVSTTVGLSLSSTAGDFFNDDSGDIGSPNGNTGTGSPIPAPFNSAILEDWSGTPNADYSIEFTGLDDSLTYDIVYALGGWTNNALTDDTAINVDGQSVSIGVTSIDPRFFTFTGLNTDGSGNLLIELIQAEGPGNNVPVISGLLLTAVANAPDVLPGDFDLSGTVDCDDLDGYVGNIGADAAGALAPLDLDNNGTLELADANMHIETLAQTPNGQVGTFPGDLNCDGSVNVLGDAINLVGNLGSSATSYAQGDINFDGNVSVLGDALILIGNLGRTNNP